MSEPVGPFSPRAARDQIEGEAVAPTNHAVYDYCPVAWRGDDALGCTRPVHRSGDHVVGSGGRVVARWPMEAGPSSAPGDFRSYFTAVIEYPHPVVNELKPGVLFTYISSTFLNGWINYVSDTTYGKDKVRRCWLVTRYRSRDQNLEQVARWHERPPVHANFNELQDDVHLVTQDEVGGWWYFWYDRDCSDCCIGRLLTTDSEEQILAAFDEYVGGLGGGENGESPSPPLLIQPSTIHGWLSG